MQFHPEHCAGPQDLEILFDVFLSVVELHKNNSAYISLVDKISEALQFKQPLHTPLSHKRNKVKEL